MGFILKIILTGIAAFVLTKFFPGIVLDGFVSAILLALLLAVLNTLVRPILVFLTIPITILTLGLFLIVINTIILYMAAYILDGFEINNVISAILYSLALSVITYIIDLFT